MRRFNNGAYSVKYPQPIYIAIAFGFYAIILFLLWIIDVCFICYVIIACINGQIPKLPEVNPDVTDGNVTPPLNYEDYNI